ncbi:Rne/Rng family ribonuclease [Terriglobus sp. ADX1]|uniref:Rne/Rng family ribonuclease n=1 Tax=Terriglobus sp. ADX1 TaxID=2794063 RepID=UPI002FE539F4
MSKEIYISTTPHETRLAIVEDEQLAEIYYERENEYTLAGSIYNGKVTRVLPGMQSAFVDIGLERDAFLYVTDFMEEQGDSADFDSAESNAGGGRRGGRERGGRDRGGRDRERGGERRQAPEASAETESTVSFDEPIAPSPTEGVGSIDAESTGGSRRWRGRRGRRRGRGRGESPEVTATTADAESVTIEGGYDEDEETTSFDAAAESSPIEIDLSAEAEAPTEGYTPSQGRGRRDDRRGGRSGRDRRGRNGGRDRDRGERSSRSADAPPYDNSYAGYDAPEEFLPEPTGEPIVLPGESIRKYRDPAEVAAEEEEARKNAPPKPEVVTVSTPLIEIVGWDGGAVLPGETLSRHKNRKPKEVAPVVEAAEPALSPEVEEALSEDAGAAFDSVPVTPIAEDAEPVAPEAEFEVASVEVVEVAEPAEYEPVEGESASVKDETRRDLRRFEQEPDKPEISAEAEAIIEAETDKIAEEADATEEVEFVAEEPAETVAAEEAIASGAETDPTTYDLHAETNTAAEPNFTTLQASGELLSVTAGVEEQGVAPIAQQDIYEPAAPVAVEGAVQSVTLAEAETTPEPVEFEEEFQPQIHAYGDGDFHEEEIDEEDEFEYEALAGNADDEEDEYEEETLEDSADLGGVLHEMHLDREVPSEDFDEEEDASGGFTEADFAGGDEDEDEDASESSTSEPRQERTERSRRGGRDRRGGRNSGGDRGRGRRQSVQTQDLPAINELLKPGQEILVQIAKEPIAKKGARITSHIALPGRFLVFMPTVNHTGVSRKISSDEERRRLKSILLSEKGDAQGGFIVRTAADGASEEELRTDLRFLIQIWNDIKQRSETSKSPALIYHDLNLVERILRDQVTDNFSAIWVDTEQEYERVLRFLQRFQPSLVRRVKLYTKETPVFEHFGITQEIDKALKSKVWLKSGGSIVINQTEALVAIDINTGKYVGKTARLEDTIVKTNLDAIPEIVRQIRLRDLGGIIVIDFIDMDDRKNRAKVLQALEDEMKTDRAPSKILPFNDFGLVIMTRKRVKQSLERTLCIPDPITEGTGMIKSPVTVANEIYVEMRKMHRHLEKQDVLLRVHPEVVKTLKANNAKRLVELEEMTRKTILLKSDPSLSPEAFDIH